MDRASMESEKGQHEKAREPTESDPLIADGKKATHWGVIGFLGELQSAVGYELLVVLFFVEHLMRGFVSAFTSQAEPFIYRSYAVPGPQMQIYQGVTALPWAMKPIIGLVSDVFPIAGYHKAPYMIGTSVMGVVAYAIVGGMPRSMVHLLVVVSCLFLQALQLSTIDILTEAKYAEKIQQVPKAGPSILTYVWFGMSFGGLIGTMLSGIVVSESGAKLTYLISAFPAGMVIVPIMLGYLQERRLSSEELAKCRQQFYEEKEACFLCVVIFLCVVGLSGCALISASPGVNAALAVCTFFVVLLSFSLVLSPPIAMFNAFSLIQTSLSLSTGGAGFYFFTDTPREFPEGPHFSQFFYVSVVGTVGSVVSLMGIICYQQYMSTWRYRNLLIFGNVALSVCSCLDLMMYTRTNVRLGIPDHAFMLSSTVLGNVINQWQWMPQVVILSYLCPPGMEATMYALLAGSHNLGNTVASSCGAYMLASLGCNPNGSPNETREFDNLWKASAISTALPLVTVLALFQLIPDVRQGDKVLEGPYAGSATAGSLWKYWMGGRDPSAATRTADEVL